MGDISGMRGSAQVLIYLDVEKAMEGTWISINYINYWPLIYMCRVPDGVLQTGPLGLLFRK